MTTTHTYHHICAGCSGPFESSRPQTRTCSPTCRQRVARASKGASAAGADTSTKRDVTDKQPDSWIGRTVWRAVESVRPGVPPPSVEPVLVVAETEQFAFVLDTETRTSTGYPSAYRSAAALDKTLLRKRGYAPGGLEEFQTWRNVYVSTREQAEEFYTVARNVYERGRREAEERAKAREAEKEERRKKRSGSGRSRTHTGPWTRPGKMDGAAAFRILGLAAGASLRDIKLAFRKLAHERHPDKGGSDTAFIEIRTAYNEAIKACQHTGRRKGATA